MDFQTKYTDMFVEVGKVISKHLGLDVRDLDFAIGFRCPDLKRFAWLSTVDPKDLVELYERAITAIKLNKSIMKGQAKIDPELN